MDKFGSISVSWFLCLTILFEQFISMLRTSDFLDIYGSSIIFLKILKYNSSLESSSFDWSICVNDSKIDE